MRHPPVLFRGAALALLFFSRLPLCHAAVVTFDAPAELVPSPSFAVTVEGRPVFVYRLLEAAPYRNGRPPRADITTFSFDGSVAVVVIAGRAFSTVTIRPVSLGILPAVSGDTIRFTLDRPSYLSIELDGDTKNPLLLFADSIETNVPSPSDPQVLFLQGGQAHDLSEFTLEQTSGRTIYIAGGALATGSIVLRQCSDITVRGRGILLNTSGSAISAYDCENLVIDGPVLINEADTAALYMGRVRNSRIDNSKIIATKNCGVVFANTSRTVLQNGFVCALDNAIALVGNDVFGFTDSVSCDTVRSCAVWSAGTGSGLAIGREMTTRAVRHCLFQDIDIIHNEQPDAAYDRYFTTAAIAIHDGGPGESFGPVEQVRYESIRIEDCRTKYLFEFTVPSMTPVNTFAYPGNRRISGIHLVDVTVTGGAPRGSVIMGLDASHPAENITFEGVLIFGRPVLNAADMSLETNEFVSGISFLPSGNHQDVPAAPESLTVSPVARAGEARLAWRGDIMDGSVFVVERASSEEGPFIETAWCADGAGECIVDGLRNGAVYFFRVRACNDAGCSEYSSPAVMETDPGPAVPDDCAFRWRFDGNGDADIGDVAVSLTGGAVFSDSGYEGSGALWLNGLDGYGDAGAVAFGDTFTIALWIRQIGNAFLQVPVSSGTESWETALNGFVLQVRSWSETDKALCFQTGNGTSSLLTESGIAAIPSGNWNHIAVAVNRTAGEATLFVNGFDKTLSSAVLADFQTDDAVLIGRASNGDAWDGYLDDLRIYRRVLNDAEVLALASVRSDAAAAYPRGVIAGAPARMAPRVLVCVDDRTARRILPLMRGCWYNPQGRTVPAGRLSAGIYVRGPVSGVRPAILP